MKTRAIYQEKSKTQVPINEVPPALSSTPTPVLCLEAKSGLSHLYLKELLEYRELLFILALRDVKIRYKQTALGALWAILQPVATMLVFTLFFGRLGKMPSDGIPYALFAFSALVPWNFFAHTLTQSSNSVVTSGELIKKIYFPRLIIPLSSSLGGALDFVLSLGVLLVMMAFYGIWPHWRMLLVIPFSVLALLTSLGIGLWLSALNVRYRDVRYTLPFLTQFWMFATPVAYSSKMLSETWQKVYALNPMVGVVEGFRYALFQNQKEPGMMLLISSVMSLVILVGGAYYFKSMERTFADKV